MTVVNIDVSDVASEFHEDDAVLFYAPAVRPASGGGVVNTRQVRVPLDRGKASKDLEPGPVMVRLQCRGIADTGEKQGTVPDEGPVTLADVLGDVYDYTPAVVSVVTRAKLDAESARDDAVEAAERVGTAEQVGEWASTAQSAASTATSIEQNLPAKVGEELDTRLPPELDERVPPEVAKALASDRTVAEAAAEAAGPAVDEAIGTRLDSKADREQVDDLSQGVGVRSVNLDDDGTPYWVESGGTHFVLTDSAGPYFTDTLARTITPDTDGTPVII